PKWQSCRLSVLTANREPEALKKSWPMAMDDLSWLESGQQNRSGEVDSHSVRRSLASPRCKMSRRFEEDSSHEISSFSAHFSCGTVPVYIFSVLRLRQERRSCCFFSIRPAGRTDFRSGNAPILI